MDDQRRNQAAELRRRAEEANPEAAAAAAARRFEHDAIAPPPALDGDLSLVARDAVLLYRCLVIAGRPMSTTELLAASYLGTVRFRQACGAIEQRSVATCSPMADSPHRELEWRLVR